MIVDFTGSIAIISGWLSVFIRFISSGSVFKLDPFSSISHDHLDPEASISGQFVVLICDWRSGESLHLFRRSSECFVYKLDTGPVIFLKIPTGLESRKPLKTHRNLIQQLFQYSPGTTTNWIHQFFLSRNT